MEGLMTVTMERGEFLRAALLLAGCTLLDLSSPGGWVHAAEMPQTRKEVTKAGEFYPAEEYLLHYSKKNPTGSASDGVPSEAITLLLLV